jgi:ethanolamine utilization cobalamin adenosyltransferase
VASLFPEEGGGELELGPGDILTPLAKDYLSAKRIPIRRAPK